MRAPIIERLNTNTEFSFQIKKKLWDVILKANDGKHSAPTAHSFTIKAAITINMTATAKTPAAVTSAALTNATAMTAANNDCNDSCKQLQ